MHHELTASLGMDGQGIGSDLSTLAYPLEPGNAYHFVCRNSNDQVVASQVMIYDPADPLGSIALNERTTDLAFAALDLPAPRIATSPPADLLVGLPTWLHVDTAWVPLNETAQIGFTTATVTATPTHVVWDVGGSTTVQGAEGQGTTGQNAAAASVTCDGPGTPYQPGATSDCTHTFRHRSTVNDPDGTFPLTSTIHWDVAYVTSTGLSGDLGVITSTTTTQVRVIEAQSVISYD